MKKNPGYWDFLLLLLSVPRTQKICVSLQDYTILYNNAILPVIHEAWHFTYMWKALAWRNISLRGKVWAHKTSLTCHFLLKCLYQTRKWAVMYLCVRGIDVDSVTTILIFDFGTVPTVWSFLFFILLCFISVSSNL